MKKRVLVVDDDEGILDAITIILEQEGYVVESLVKGEEVYETVTSFKPQSIILDVLMSGSDGRTIVKRLKANVLTRDIPIIMISAHPSARAGAKEVGADAFLAKPFDALELITIVALNTK